MKKKILVSLFIMVVSLLVVGCGKKDWSLNMKQTFEFFDEDIRGYLEEAINNYKDEKLSPIAYFGEQVVAGKNYMFLCESDGDYKVVVIYHDLEGNSKVTKVTDFDINDYVNKDSELNTELLSGGWTTTMPGKALVLDEKVEKVFNEAINGLVGVSYYPVAIFEKEDSYAMICYGRMSDKNGTTGVYVLTINTNNDNTKLDSIANIDLSQYNK